MVNMAGGVMENAGLCLDRFGLPYIPGSAVKGCARRAALAALHDWCETGAEPQHKPSGEENAFTAPWAPFESPADMLAAIARVFGWCELDWMTREEVLKGMKHRNGEDDAQFHKRCQERWEEKRPDFAWACGDTLWLTVRSEVLHLLDATVIKDFAGCISLLPAYPADVPAGTQINDTMVPPLGKLELDVVTCHHQKYYGGNPAFASAPDTEEPVPVVFPAVAPGHVFAFSLAPFRGCSDNHQQHARTWLSSGLQLFGLGAKTAAGYGWFKDVTRTVADVFERQRELEEVQSKARRFAALSDNDRLDFIIALTDKSEICRAWREKHPESAKAVDAFAQEIGSPLP